MAASSGVTRWRYSLRRSGSRARVLPDQASGGGIQHALELSSLSFDPLVLMSIRGPASSARNDVVRAR